MTVKRWMAWVAGLVIAVSGGVAAEKSEAPRFLVEPFAAQVEPETILRVMRQVAECEITKGQTPKTAGARHIWFEGLRALAAASGDERYRTMAGQDGMGMTPLDDIDGRSANRRRALELYDGWRKLAARPAHARWGAPEFKPVTSMSNRALCRDEDFLTASLAIHVVGWGINQPLGIMVIDYFRVPLLDGWMNVISRIQPDGRIPGDEGDAGLRAGAFLLAAAQVLDLSRAMAQPQPYTRTEEYRQDVVVQRERLAKAPMPDSAGSLAAMRKACEYQLGHLFKGGEWNLSPDTSWLRGTFFIGITAAYKATQDSYYLERAKELARRTDYKPGPTAGKLHGANDFAISQVYLELYELEKRSEMLGPTRETMESALREGKVGRFELYWVDALFMSPPAWMHMAKITGDRKYRDHINALWWETVDKLWDPSAGLVYRDRTYIVQPSGLQLRECNGRKVFWGRGNGWFTGALCRVLDHLPADHPDRAKYEGILKAQLISLAALQQPGGLWPTSLLDQDGYPMGDTSCSTFFCYGFAWAINRGLIDKAVYLPVAEKAWKAIVACVEEDGRLSYVQAEADSTRAPLYRKMNAEYGTGALLLAGSEMLPYTRKQR